MYVRAENTFSIFEKKLYQYAEWCNLDTVNVQAFVDNDCTDTGDYAFVFSTLEKKQKSLIELPDYDEIEDCALSISEFKHTISDIIIRSRNIVCYGLRNTIVRDYEIVDKFISSSSNILKSIPSTIEEICNSRAAYDKIELEKSSVRELSGKCGEKLKLLMKKSFNCDVLEISPLLSAMSGLDNSPVRLPTYILHYFSLFFYLILQYIWLH